MKFSTEAIQLFALVAFATSSSFASPIDKNAVVGEREKSVTDIVGGILMSS